MKQQHMSCDQGNRLSRIQQNTNQENVIIAKMDTNWKNILERVLKMYDKEIGVVAAAKPQKNANSSPISV